MSPPGPRKSPDEWVDEQLRNQHAAAWMTRWLQHLHGMMFCLLGKRIGTEDGDVKPVTDEKWWGRQRGGCLTRLGQAALIERRLLKDINPFPDRPEPRLLLLLQDLERDWLPMLTAGKPTEDEAITFRRLHRRAEVWRDWLSAMSGVIGTPTSTGATTRLGDAQIRSRLYRLRAVLEGMIQSLRAATARDPDPYGGIEGRFDAAADHARDLGLPAPPVQWHKYDRDGKSCIWPTIDRKPHDPADEPFYWMTLRSKRYFRCAHGFRVHCLPGTSRVPAWDDIIVSTEVDGAEAPANRLREPEEFVNVEEHRRQILIRLESWREYVDGELLACGGAQLSLVKHGSNGATDTLAAAPQSGSADGPTAIQPPTKRNKRRGGSKRKYDADTDEKRVRDYRASGMTVKEFAASRGIAYPAMRKTIDRVRDHERRKAERR